MFMFNRSTDSSESGRETDKKDRRPFDKDVEHTKQAEVTERKSIIFESQPTTESRHPKERENINR